MSGRTAGSGRLEGLLAPTGQLLEGGTQSLSSLREDIDRKDSLKEFTIKPEIEDVIPVPGAIIWLG